jgi:hypothetical protein
MFFFVPTPRSFKLQASRFDQCENDDGALDGAGRKLTLGSIKSSLSVTKISSALTHVVLGFRSPVRSPCIK